MNREQYIESFKEPEQAGAQIKESETRAGRALSLALDIRKFEIELYWKRATYFWAFIGATFAGYALTYKTANDHEPWLSIVFSALGLMFSFGWYLVNRGSKFWQNNWERHVDLLEDMTLGPLYKVIATDGSPNNPLISAGAFSVTKINQILSVFVVVFWLLLFGKSVTPVSPSFPMDIFKFLIIGSTVLCLLLLYCLGRSGTGETRTKLEIRKIKVD